MEILIFVVGALSGATAIALLFLQHKNKSVATTQENNFLNKAVTERDERIALLEHKLAEQQHNITEQHSEISVLKHDLAEKEQQRAELTKEFKLLSSQILEDNSKNLLDKNSQELDKILAPFKERVGDLEKKIATCYDTELRDKVSLKAEVKKLFELNFKLSKDAENLTKALKGDNKIQGNWGEVILESILERSGLSKGEEYEIQERSENNQGELIQPDVVVYLPENKHIIIDAKISLKDYEQYVNVENDDDRAAALSRHVKSLKNHISELSKKNYQTSKKHQSLDFILMFIPIESSYLLAMQSEPDLFWDAWEKKIMIVSPATLHSTLKIIVALWRQEKQSKNTREIARASGALYDKFANFLEDMQKIGRSLKTADKTYNDALQKLSTGRGNIISRLENIKLLGAKSSKQLPANLLEEDD